MPFVLTIHLPAEGLDEGSHVDFFLRKKGSELREIIFLLSLHQPQTSHDHCWRIVVMFTMLRKDLQHVNWSRVAK